MKQLICTTACVFSILSVLTSCGGSKSPEPEPPAKAVNAAEQVANIKIGDSKEYVESLIGKPSSNELNVNYEVVTYMLGMEEMLEQARAASSVGSGTSIIGGLLNSALGLASLAGPAGGIAASVGSSVVGMGSAAVAGANSYEPPDTSKIRIVIIRYEDGRVVSIRNQSLGSPMLPQDMGAGYPQQMGYPQY